MKVRKTWLRAWFCDSIEPLTRNQPAPAAGKEKIKKPLDPLAG